MSYYITHSFFNVSKKIEMLWFVFNKNNSIILWYSIFKLLSTGTPP